jgi:hypothetical protein
MLTAKLNSDDKHLWLNPTLVFFLTNKIDLKPYW